MKYFYFLFFVAICYNTNAQSKASIGMNINNFISVYPNAPKSVYQNTVTYSVADTLYNLPGEWGYRFENDKLNWIFFSKYLDEINQANFDLCYNSAKNIISDYTKYYGTPDSVYLGDTTFIDPFIKHHWGYHVIDAYWKNKKNMDINASFNFFGGKGEYHFIVTINYFENK